MVHPQKQTSKRRLDLFGSPLPEVDHQADNSDSNRIQKIRQIKSQNAWDKKCKAEWNIPKASDVEVIFRHSGWSARRNKIRQAMSASGASWMQLGRWDECGANASVEFSETKQAYRVRASHCKCRHCEPCAKSRATKIATNIAHMLEQTPKPGDRFRFVTLTQAHNDKPLTDQINDLYSNFKKLRTTDWWKRRVEGGAFVCEIKLSQDRRWHVHMHCVIESGWLDQSELADQWRSVTKNSHVVHITRIENARNAAWYVAKYITKTTDTATWSDNERARELIIALKGRRICATLGTWRGCPLMKVDDSVTDWIEVTTVNDLYKRAAAGEVHAANLLIILRRPPKTEHDPPTIAI